MSDASSPQVQVGDLIAGKYRVEREIGKGGMGVVVAAVHVELDQRVAIKVLNSSAAQNPDFAGRFSREARAAAKIRNEHVARVMDVGTLDGGVGYIVMEYLDGEDLAEVLRRRGALPLPVAVDYILQACEAIAAAHAAGIVHRDIKPANLFLARQPDRTFMVKVLDFGVSKVTTDARKADDAGAVTRTGDVFGSPTYMSPEQLRATGRVDARADIWALGVVLYELLTNATPFWRGAVAEVLASIMRDPAPRLRESLSDAPPEVEAVIARCLEKESGARFANVAEMARALLPFAPKGAEAAVERMERLLGSADVTRDLPAADAAPRSGEEPGSTSDRAMTTGGWRLATAPTEEVSSSLGGAARTSEPATSRPSLGAKIALAAAILAAGAGAAWMLRSGGRAQQGQGPTTTSSPPASASSAPAVSATSSDAATADASADVALQINGAPADTKVYQGAVLLGTLPGSVRLPRGAEKVTLRLEAKGHAPATIDVVPSADREITVSMARAASAPPVSAPPRRRVSKDLETF